MPKYTFDTECNVIVTVNAADEFEALERAKELLPTSIQAYRNNLRLSAVEEL